MNRPAFQFYPGDWRRDLNLRRCSPAARGLWIDLLCLMHEGTPYGHLSSDSGPISDRDAAQMVGVDLKSYRRLLQELEREKVASRSGDGAVFSRRMVRDEDIRQRRAAGGLKSIGHPHCPAPKATPERVPSEMVEGYAEGYNAVPPPSSSSSSSELTTTPQSPPLGGADAPVVGVALTLHRNGNGNGNGKHGKAVVKRLAAPAMAEVQARIVSLMADMSREAGAELRLEERRAVMVDLTFAYWAAKLKHEEAKLDRKRFQTIRSRLVEAGDNVHQLLFAVDGTLKDDTLMGRKGDSARKYDGVSTIFRDFEQVERLANLGGYREGKAHAMALRHLEPILTLAAHGGN